MREYRNLTFSCFWLAPCLVHAAGDGTFQAPFSIRNHGRPGPVTIHAGDLNRDGKLDLLASNGSGSVLVIFQSPTNRLEWQQLPLRIGTSCYFARAGDFDGDGADDIVLGDTGSTAWFIRSRGDGTFDRPRSIPQSNGSRWIALGDWNNDGKLDLASANLDSSNVTVFIGDGTGNFAHVQTLPGQREHTLEAGDYDGDGNADLFLGVGLPGVIPQKGRGEGTFEQRAVVGNLGCVEYIATGDFNADGLTDLAPTCIDFQNAFVGISKGDGTFRKTLEVLAGGSTESSAVADLDQDGALDLALTSKGYTTLLVFSGKGDGTFQTPVSFGPTGLEPAFLIAPDLDGDGLLDVASADTASSTVTIFWGRRGPAFLESGIAISGFVGAKSMAAGDFDRDGRPDLFFPRTSLPVVPVYLKAGDAPQNAPSAAIETAHVYFGIEVVDLDGDGNVDLAGFNAPKGTALVTFLDAAGKPKGEQLALAAGILPSSIALGRIDEGPALDLAVACPGSNHAAVFLGQGGGAFAAAKIVPSIPQLKDLTLGDLDGDGRTDMALIANPVAAVQFGQTGIGRGAGEFDGPVTLVSDSLKAFADVAIADVTGDSLPDVVVADSKSTSPEVHIFRGTGGRTFEKFPPISVARAPVSLAIADLNGDGRLDITTANSIERSLSVLLSRGDAAFEPPAVYGIGFPPISHRLADVNQDGALDLVAHSGSNAMILLGRLGKTPAPGRFRRGDVDGDAAVNLSDPIFALNALFLGGEAIACSDAADINDDGVLNLSDPIAELNALFLGGDPIAPPGADVCGEDPVGDDLAPCGVEC